MFAMKLLAAGSTLPLALAYPAEAARMSDKYVAYTGTAETEQWPAERQWWKSFDTM